MSEPEEYITIRGKQVRVTRRALDEGIGRLTEKQTAHLKRRNNPTLLDTECPVPRAKAHQVKRLRYAEPWRPSGAKSSKSVQVRAGIDYDTGITSWSDVLKKGLG